jgi:N-methylhydantoinase A
VTYQVYRRERLGRGNVIAGPAIIEELTATTLVHARDVLAVGDHGELNISIAQDRPRTARSGTTPVTRAGAVS